MSTGAYDCLYQTLGSGPPIVKPKFEDVTVTQDIYGNVESTRRTAESLKYKVEKDRYNDIAILIRRRLSSTREALWIQMEIQSPDIQETVTKVCGHSDLLNTKVSPIVIRKPYLILFHYRAELREYDLHSDRTDQEKVHLKVLVDFMAKAFTRDEAEYSRLIDKGQVSFPIVWTLFKPEEEVFIHESHFVRCGRVQSLHGINKTQGWSLGTRSWDYDGTFFGPVDSVSPLQPFEGICDITSLPVYPVRFHKNQNKDDLRQRLIERGRKWKSMVDVTHLSYEGSDDNSVQLQVSSRIITDYATHQQANPHHATAFSWYNASLTKQTKEPPADDGNDDGDDVDDAERQTQALEKEDKEAQKEHDRFFLQRHDSSYIMSDDQALLCPAKIRGFSLMDKKWAFFLVENATDIQWLENPMERLEIDGAPKKS
ncbi:hypothetical protein N0V83_002453 [Neocucurbitaria cava]|uniref:DUF7025 domain-containing protein n=1 Tax=Neocucurbitaria cava TaxID=798079 RepID=A0A9W9CQT2_9PLEO|nr:hypothetical protein N0V83_002453 [Neocucurbitaria cava]